MKDEQSEIRESELAWSERYVVSQIFHVNLAMLC